MASRKAAGGLVLYLVLLCGFTLSLPTRKIKDRNVDVGGDLDIFEINEAAGLDLVEGDIMLDERQTRNSIIGDEYRWPTTVPYYMEDSLEINAKGVILKAFEQYRLKSCIDFKPWEGEENYISIIKGSGCWSYVGNLRAGKQELSIGTNCDHIATTEHEFLHALGFWHEQSRSDRDDYVTIMWDRILDGKEHNFVSYDDTTSSNLGVPYDYTSMMHYSKTAFRNGTEPTIVTKIEAFSDVIGQRMEFSDSDILKLNRMYNCTQGSTFLDSCDFELENICGMIQGQGDQADWVRVDRAGGGPDTDFTHLGNCEGSGYFMHFNTGTGNNGDIAYLESRFLYPKRGYQCLQFFYYNSGNPADSLSIYVREYDAANPNGVLRLIQTIDGPPGDEWQLHHVSLDATKKFRVVFKGTKGVGGSSTGGLSLDDINLSETTCPEFVWRVKNFSDAMDNTPVNTPMYSPVLTSKEGYSFQIGLYPNGVEGYEGQLSFLAHLVAREGDTGKEWPCPWKQMTVMLMDQISHIQHRMSNQRSITTDPTLTQEDGQFFWDDPRVVGTEVTDPDGSKYFRGPGSVYRPYLTHLRARSRDFLKGGDAIFLLTMEDLSHLTVSQPLPSPNPTTTNPPATTNTPSTNPPATTNTPSTNPSATTNTPSTNPSATTNTPSTNPSATTNTPSTNPPATTPPFDACQNVDCQNEGVCVEENGKPACRCVVGDNWWYYGDRCQYRGSNNEKTTLALATSLPVFAAMLVILVVSVLCVKKKYQKKGKNQGFPMNSVKM